MQHQNSSFIIQNVSAEAKSAEILIYDHIPYMDEEWKMHNTATQFVNEIKRLEAIADTIHIRINSPGGSVFHGFPMFNAIKNSKAKIITYNDGLAASMAGLLFLAGHERKAAKNSVLMIHSSISSCYGNAEKFQESIKVLETYDNIITQMLAELSGKTEEEIKTEFINYKDHFLDAKTAKSYNFVDEIEDYESQAKLPKNIANMSHLQIAALFSAPHSQPKPSDNMNFDQLTNSISDLLTAENVNTLLDKVNAKLGENTLIANSAVQAKIDEATQPLQTSIQNLTNEKTQLEGDLQTQKDLVQTKDDEIEELKNQIKNLPQNRGGDHSKDLEEFKCEMDLQIKNSHS